MVAIGAEQELEGGKHASVLDDVLLRAEPEQRRRADGGEQADCRQPPCMRRRGQAGRGETGENGEGGERAGGKAREKEGAGECARGEEAGVVGDEFGEIVGGGLFDHQEMQRPGQRERDDEPVDEIGQGGG